MKESDNESGVDLEAVDPYAYHMRSEAHENKVPVQIDPEHGWRYTYRDIGMTRNAAQENTKEMKVFLDPLPHVVLDQNVPLRGWYKSKVEKPGVRNRPCYTEAILTQPYGGFCHVGCGFAIMETQLVDTPSGQCRIEELRSGDMIWGRSPLGIVPSTISHAIKKHAPSALRIVAGGHVIEVTGDHPVWTPKRGWVEASTLRVGEQLETFSNDAIVRNVRSTVRHGHGEVLHAMSVSETSGEFLSAQAPKAQRSKALRNVRRAFASSQAGILPALRGQGESETYVGQSPRREGAATETMQALRRSIDQSVTSLMRSMPRGEPQDRSSGEYIRTRQQRQAQVSGVEAEVLETVCCVQDDLAYEGEAVAIPETIRERNLDAVKLGMEGGVVDGSAIHRLGIRDGVADSGPRTISARFSPHGRHLHRGQRVLEQGRAEEVSPIPATLANRSLDGARTDESRLAVITSIEAIPGGACYDIETTTENFYVNGVLVHNCYINNGVRGYRGQGISTVDPNYATKVRKQIGRMRSGAAVYMSSFIDPFMELEEFYHNTQGTAQAATDAGLPIFFLTRKVVPGWAYDELKKSKYSYMQFSINTDDPDDWKRLSPRASPLLDQLEQIREMKRHGIYVSIQVNPIMAGITSNQQILHLIHMLKDAGADHLIFKFVEIVYPSVEGMIYQMEQRFGKERATRFRDLFICNIGGVRTIDEQYRIAALMSFKEECKKVGTTMGVCYEYEFERDAEGKIVNSTGVSMGAKFLTGDQCHGHRVPMHFRDNLEDQFEPFEECPPSGCLTCSDQSGGDHKVPCGNSSLALASAIKPQDYIEISISRK